MNRRGSVMVYCLFVLAALVGVLATVAASQNAAAKTRIQELDQERAKRAAYAGLQRALAAIRETYSQTNQGQTGGTGNNANLTTLQDAWALLGNTGAERFALARSSFRLQILDEASFININTANEAQLQRLPLTQVQIDSLLDYRTGNREPRAQGAKDEFYNNLPNGYNAKLSRFDTVDELLLVRDFTPATLYERIDDVSGTNQIVGPDGQVPILADVFTSYSFSPEINSTGQTRVNVNAQATNAQRLQQAPISLPFLLAQQVAARKNWTGVGEILGLPLAQNADVRQRILDNLTTSGNPRSEGRLNLNTVTETVLSSVPELTPDAVEAILQRQTQGFTSLGDLATVPGITNAVLTQVASRFSVISQTFRVRIMGESGSARFPLEVTIDVQNNLPKVIAVQRPPRQDVLARWNWQPEPTAEIELEAGS